MIWTLATFEVQVKLYFSNTKIEHSGSSSFLPATGSRVQKRKTTVLPPYKNSPLENILGNRI